MKSCPIVLLMMILFLSEESVVSQISHEEDSTASNSGVGLSLGANILPHGEFTLTPLVSLSLGHFAGELRYNYEDLKTFSAAVGYRFFRDSAFWYEIDPMIAGSVGRFNGLSPALSAAFGYGRFAGVLSSEYSFSLDSSAANDYFIWASFYFGITPSIYVGVDAQRSKLFQSNDIVDAGVLAGFAPGAFDFYAAVNNFWSSNRYYLVGIGYFITIKNKKHRAPDLPNKQD